MNLSSFENGTYQVGRVVGAISASCEEGVTEPPVRYTQATLLDDMLGAHKFAKNDGERAVLRQISGLGTSRTREPAITGLIEAALMYEAKRKGGRKGAMDIIPTEAGMTIIGNVPEVLKSVATTAKWELAFRMIEKGKATPADVSKHLRLMLDGVIEKAKGGGAIEIKPEPKKTSPVSKFVTGLKKQ